MSSQETAGAQYGALVIEQLSQERSRQASLEARGLAVVTTSGILVSLLLGLAAATTSAKSFMLPRAAHGPLVVALGSFVLAAVLGITTNIPLPADIWVLFYNNGGAVALAVASTLARPPRMSVM